MRRQFVALGSTVAVLLVATGYAQIGGGNARDFSAAALTAPPAAGWPTNGGNLYNQRYSPLKTINRDNVAQLKGVWRTRLRGSGAAPQYSGFAQPLVHDGVAYVSTGANDVFALSIDTGEILWQYTANLDPTITSVCCGWNNKGVALGAGQGVHRSARRHSSSRSIAPPARWRGRSRPSGGRTTSRSRLRPCTSTAW